MKNTLQGGMNDQYDIMVFILYLLDSINYPLDYTTLHDVIVQNGYVGQFDFAECFSKLRERGHIIEDEQDGEVYYLISPTGKMVAAELQSNLLLSIREKSLKSALRLLSFRRRNAKFSSEVGERADGKFTLHCEITDPEGSLLNLDLCVPSRLQAEAMQKKFEKEPEGIYRRIVAIMAGDAEYALQ